MNNKETYLVLGGNSTAAQEIIKGIRKEHSQKNTQAIITATTTRNLEIPNVDVTIRNTNLSDSKNVDSLISNLENKPNYIISTLARGEVGFPAWLVTDTQIKDSLDFSYLPCLKLIKELRPKYFLGLSAYAWIDHMLLVYGVMTYSKYLLEQIITRPEVVNAGTKVKILRLPLYETLSSRGILIMAQRYLKSATDPESIKSKERWKKSGVSSLGKFMVIANTAVEKQIFEEKFKDKVFKEFTISDISEAVQKTLYNEDVGVFNTISGEVWLANEDKTKVWPEYVHSKNYENYL